MIVNLDRGNGASFLFVLFIVLMMSFIMDADAACDDPPVSGVDWNDCDKSGVDLEEVDLSFSELRRVNLNGANLKGANFSGARLMRSTMVGADVTDTNFDSAHLSGVVWIDGTLCGFYSVGKCGK